MLYLVEFCFYLIYFITKLYSLIDKKIMLSVNGDKLEKYIQNNNQSNITCNFACKNNNFNLSNLIKIFSSPSLYKKIIIVSLIYISLISVKIAFTYDFLCTNFFYVSFFGKSIDLVSHFDNFFQIFKILYYLLFSFFAAYITIKIIKYVADKKEIKNTKYTDNNVDNLDIKIGIDDDSNEVTIKEKGLYQNVLITGSIGSGKTSSAISNILDSFINKDIGGLIIDVKGNYIETIRKIALNASKEDRIIEISLDSKYIYNPLNSSISNMELANRLRRVLELTSTTNNSDSFWIDKVESFVKDFITLIRAYDEYINFYELHKLVIHKKYLLEKLAIIKEKILNNTFNESELFEINSAILNINNEYLTLDERTIGIIKSEITRITNIFVSDYSIYNKFCAKGDVIDFTKGNIVVLSIDVGKNKSLLKIIATYLKLDFQKQILSQNKIGKPIFFICDEYQEIVNIEDAHFFSLSREYKCISVICMQSYTSLVSVLENENDSRAIIQNLVNKIWFRNDDTYTVVEIVKQIGKEYKNNKSVNYSQTGTNSRYSLLAGKFRDYKTGLSKGYSISEKLEDICSENYFTTYLRTFEAVCILSTGNLMKLYKKVNFKIWGSEYEN